MSNGPTVPPSGNKGRWVFTGCLLVLAIGCAAWVVSVATSGRVAGGSPAEKASALVLPFAALDVLALIGLGVWVLRPPVPGALGFFGRWLGKVLLFIGLGLAILVFFFATCWAVSAL